MGHLFQGSSMNPRHWKRHLFVAATSTVAVALHAPATIRHVKCIQHPDRAKFKAIHTADSHRVALMGLMNDSFVIHFQDDMPCIVDVGEVGRNSGAAIDKIDGTYRE
jgi:hypothetical protein